MSEGGACPSPPRTDFGSENSSGLVTEAGGPEPSVGVFGHLELFMTNMENISQTEEQTQTTKSEA